MAVLPYDFGSATTPDRNFFTQLQVDLEAIGTAAPLTPEQFGAVGDGVTDDLAAIDAAIAYAAANSVSAIFLAGSYRVSGTINITGSNLTFRGGAVNKDTPVVSRIVADLAVTPVLSINGSFNVWVMDLQITRAAGTPGGSTTGIYVNNFNYCGERNVLCDRHGYGRYLDNTTGGSAVSIQYDMDTPFSSNIVTADLLCNNVAQLKCRFGEFGRNGGETYDRATAMVVISANANDILFVGCNFIPRGPTPNSHGAVKFLNVVDPSTGFFQFVNCNVENCIVGLSSDAASTTIQDLHVIAGRWITSGGLFDFNAATRTVSAIFNGVQMKGGTIVNPEWMVMAGCSVTGGMSFTGATSAALALSGKTSLVFSGNTLIDSGLTLTTNWHNLCVVGNGVVQGTITDTSAVATGVNKVVASNATLT